MFGQSKPSKHFGLVALVTWLFLPAAGSAQSRVPNQDTAAAQSGADLASEVNPFIGSGVSPLHTYGRTMPGAVMPFGMLFWSPDPLGSGSYKSTDTATAGFSLTHVDGAGCGLFGEVRVLPIEGDLQTPPPQEPNTYAFSYDPSSQVAQPGFYEVKSSSGIEVELAAAARSGIAQIGFPAGSQSHTLIIDLSRNLSRVTDTQIDVQGKVITGSVAAEKFCQGDNHYRVFFALEVNREPASEGTFNEIRLNRGSGSVSGPRTGGYLTFPKDTRTVPVRVAISYVSVANALLNLKREIPGWDFTKVRNDARAAWNEALGHVVVDGGDAEQRRVFYTALYHSLLAPSTFSDINSEYLGFDNVVHSAGRHVQYANFSGWDLYRSQVQLVAMLYPKVASDMAQSLVVDAQQGGGLPLWPVANDDAHIMAGDPSDIILASAYAFGARDFDAKAALAAMLRGADDPRVHSRLYPERSNLDEYLRKGYVTQNPLMAWPGAASVTLEYANADFAISRFADALGDHTAGRAFLVRSANWRKLFDPNLKYIRARDRKDQFLEGFTPGAAVGFMEGNSSQYTWMVPYDLNGVITAVGGPEAARVRLDDYFSKYGSMKSGDANFNIGNEPSFGNPWIYNWTDHPWRTQEVVRKTLGDLFRDVPGGLPGNDDLGATSAWAVLACLGIYPEIPAVGGVTLNSPIFSRVTLHLGTHPLRILAAGSSVENRYIESVTLDGVTVDDWWISWDRLSTASRLEFKLGERPDKNPGKFPPSFAPVAIKNE